MNENLLITHRELTPGDGKAIAALHLRAFPSHKLRYTIFAAPGVGSLIDDLLSDDDQIFVGALRDRDLVGYMQIRTLEGGLHLNNIAADPAYRGRGIGRQLFRRFVDRARQFGGRHMTLDVDIENERARDWYHRHLFKETSANLVCLAERDDNDGNGDDIEVYISADEQCRLDQTGIARMRVRAGKQSFEVGVIGTSLYRIDARHDQDLVSALHSLDPKREVIVLVASETDLNCKATVVQKNVRMARPL